MKRKPLKKDFVLLILFLFILPIVACSSPGVSEVESAKLDTDVNSPVTAETAADSELVEITLWATGSVSEADPPPEDWVVYDMIREDLGIELKLELFPNPSDGEAALYAAAAANELPDLMQIITANGDSRAMLSQFADSGLIAPVDDMFNVMPYRTELYYNDRLAAHLASFNGAQYGLPQPPQIPKRQGFVIRQDWLDNLGLDAPTTLEEFYDVAVAFTYDDPDGNGIDDTYGFGVAIDGQGLGYRFNHILGAYDVAGQWKFQDIDDFGLNVRDPKYPEAIAFLHSLTEAGVLDPEWHTLDKNEFRVRWKQGQYGMMFEDFAALTNKSNYTPFYENFPYGRWSTLPAPKGPYGDAWYGVYTGRGAIYAVSQAAADAGKQDKIAELLDWVATHGYWIMGFGEEGVNYTINELGDVTTDGLPDPDLAYNGEVMQPYTQLRGLAFFNNPAEIRARYPIYSLDDFTMYPMDYLEFDQAQKWVDARGVQVIPALDNATEFERFYTEGLVQFITGENELNDQTWAEYLAGLDSLGAQEWEDQAEQALIDAGLKE